MNLYYFLCFLAWLQNLESYLYFREVIFYLKVKNLPEFFPSVLLSQVNSFALIFSPDMRQKRIDQIASTPSPPLTAMQAESQAILRCFFPLRVGELSCSELLTNSSKIGLI